ncbi:MAG: hypothetical protein AB1411_02690 [Nitrospirota bacterium]
MTLIQIVVLIDGKRVWVSPAWALPRRSMTRSAPQVANVARWTAAAFQPGQFLDWLRHGLRFKRAGGIAGPLKKTLVYPDFNGALPAWITGDRTGKPARSANGPWTPEEKRRREQTVGAWMEKRFETDMRITPKVMAYQARYYLMGREPRMMPWLIKLAQRVKVRLWMRQRRAERRECQVPSPHSIA